MQLVDSTDGVQLAVHDLGGDGPDLLLCPRHRLPRLRVGAARGRLLRRPLPRRWPSTTAATATPPRRPAARSRWAGFRDDTMAVVDGLALDPPAAMGHSMGGAALLMAELARPGTFRALVLFEPIVLPPDRPAANGGQSARRPAPAGAGATFGSRERGAARTTPPSRR